VHVHLPHLEDEEEPPAESSTDAPAADPPKSAGTGRHPPRWMLKVGLEVLLISIGVFLALTGEQWREASHTRELADESLRRFRAEILTNRKAVAAVKDYHATTLKSLQSYLAADPKMRSLETVQIKGVQPAFFEHTAWDLALATQSLAHIDPPVAFALSRIYGTQQTYAELTRGFVQAMYLRPLTESFEGLSYYYGDLVFMEPALLRLYDEALPQIDRELAE
jgi:hypothetical protein